MKSRVLISQFSLIISMFLCCAAFSQDGMGSLQGKITDKETGDPLPFANVSVQLNDSVVGGSTTDFDGKYFIKAISPGAYTVKASYVGYQNLQFNHVKVTAGQVTFLDMQLVSDGGVALQEVTITNYCIPMIRKDKNTMGGKITREHFSRLPTRSVQSTSIRGSRASGNQTFIDGIKVSSSNGRRRIIPGTLAEQNTEEYSDYQENGFQSPVSAPLSTFSIDVDAASYSMIRRMLNEGNLPPADAVRIEEVINYFPYSYKEPEGEVPFSVYTEYGRCSWNEKHNLAMIGIKGKVVETADIPKSNLVFLIDVSGSMNSPDKLPLLKRSMNLLVSQLREDDRISMVVYAGSSGVVLKPTSGRQKDRIMAAIENLSAGGSTAGGAGLEMAYELAGEHFIKGGNNRIILATDGDFNVGISTEDDLKKLIEEKRESGIYLSVLGFGQGNIKDNKMEKLADFGNGNYAYIDNMLEAQKVLISEMGGTLLTIAKDVKIQVEFNPAMVQAYRLVGYETRLLNDEDFNDDTRDAGELGAGQDVTALFEIIPRGVKDDMAPDIDSLKYSKVKKNDEQEFGDEVLTVKLRYKMPDEKKSRLLSKAVRDEVLNLETSSDDFRFASAVAQYGMLLRDSRYKGTSSFDKVIELAKNAKGDDALGYKGEFIRLAGMAELLSKRVAAD